MIIQSYCTVNEVLDGSDLRGSKREAEIFDKILSASRLLEMRVGQFLPVTETRKLQARAVSTAKLFLPFPLLALTSITNDGTALTSDDYAMRPNGAHWSNGPFSMIEIASEASNLSAWDTDTDGIVVVGNTGLYNASQSTGATLGAAISTTSATTLQVSDGSKASPGAVVLVDSEWMFVRETGVPVTSVTTLGANLDANAETCTFADGSLVNVGEVIRVGVEQMRVLDVNGNSGYLQRGWNKTTKVAHTSGDAVDVYRKFTVDRGVNGSTAATHESGAAVARQMVPSDVNELARKIAVRMLKDAQTGYAGRVGDETLGQATYTYILPHELDEVADRYRLVKVG